MWDADSRGWGARGGEQTPRWLRGKESACQCRRHRRCGFSPWVRKFPWRKWQPTPILLPGKFHGQRSLVGYSLWDCKELDMTECTHTHIHTHTHLSMYLFIYLYSKSVESFVYLSYLFYENSGECPSLATAIVRRVPHLKPVW